MKDFSKAFTYNDLYSSSEDNIPQQTVNDKLNKSDNWAETSFGREVMNVSKCATITSTPSLPIVYRVNLVHTFWSQLSLVYRIAVIFSRTK